jgi:hypothetical protein
VLRHDVTELEPGLLLPSGDRNVIVDDVTQLPCSFAPNPRSLDDTQIAMYSSMTGLQCIYKQQSAVAYGIVRWPNLEMKMGIGVLFFALIERLVVQYHLSGSIILRMASASYNTLGFTFTGLVQSDWLQSDWLVFFLPINMVGGRVWCGAVLIRCQP